jgi:hypothetical protein
LSEFLTEEEEKKNRGRGREKYRTHKLKKESVEKKNTHKREFD